MARAKKASVRINCYLAVDAAKLLEEWCTAKKITYTFAIEQLLRLHVPVLLKQPAKSDRVLRKTLKPVSPPPP